MSSAPVTTLSLMCHPYQSLRPVTGGGKQLRAEGRRPGSALIWRMGTGSHPQDVGIVRNRPGGLALIAVLPHDRDMPRPDVMMQMVEDTRPHVVLPYHERIEPEDLALVLRQPPEDLGSEITDYLKWRGIPVDRETGRLVRRTVALSAELRSISALARSLYLSRRALGRRFMTHGLPVPSHWLHFARLLRVAIRLQSSDDSVLSVGYDLGYPDGFSLSNQMARLTGYRPSEARMFLGWEWLLEAWLRQEAETGGLAPAFTQEFLGGEAPRAEPLDDMLRRPARRDIGGKPGRRSIGN